MKLTSMVTDEIKDYMRIMGFTFSFVSEKQLTDK